MTRHTAPLRAAIMLAAMAIAGAASAQGPGSRQTRDFIAAAGQSDAFEKFEAVSALAQSQNPGVRSFAQMMIRDHTATGRAMTDAAARSGLAGPGDAVNGDQSEFLAALQSARGRDFDRLYWQQQLLAHTAALVTETAYAASGDTPAIRDAARAAIPLIQSHLEMARRMSQAGG